MAHGHSHHHLVQRDILSDIGKMLGKNSNPSPTQSAAPVVYVTESPTFTGAVGGYITQTQADATTTAPPKGVGPPVQPPPTTSAKDTKPATTETTKTTKTVPTSTTERPSSTSEVPSTTTEAPTTTFSTAAATTSILATTSALSAGVEQVSSVPSATPFVSASTSAGLSGGAKAGIAIGVLLGLAAIAGLVLFWLHRQKKNREEAAAADNEKSFTPSQPPMMSASPMTPTYPSQSPTRSTPPQVSLRPVTQFNPTLDVGRSYGGTALAAGALGAGVGAAAAAGTTRNLTGNQSEQVLNGTATSPSPPQGSPDPFNDPVNPFENGDEVSSPPTPLPKDLPLAGETSPSPTGSVSGVPAGLIAGKPTTETAGAAAIGDAVGAAVGGAAVAASKAAETEPRQQRTPSPEYREGSPEGTSGSRPQSPVVGGAPFVSNVHRVQMDFTPSLADEMELKAGQLVRLLKNYDDGWAQCSSMDGSIKGIAPRSCLSARPLQPRNRGSPGGSRPASPGPRMMGPNGRPMSPARMPGGPAPPRFYQDGRPMSPGGGRPGGPNPTFPAPPPGRSMSPGPGRASADLPRPLTPGGSSRPSSPIGGGGRSRSNSASVGMMQTRPVVPPVHSPLAAALPPAGPLPPPIIQVNGQPQSIERKPVPSAPTSSN